MSDAGIAAVTALLKYDAACRAVAEAKSFDEVREWEDKAAAVREYSRRARNREMELDALEIRERARRRRGELLLELKAQGHLIEGRKKLSVSADSSPMTLDDIEVSANESSRDQKIARLDGDSFERLITRCRNHLEAEERKHSFDVLRERDGPVNGARSIMGSRQEPPDSLDYFPTPPWATRALVEEVLPRAFPVPKRIDMWSAWEPACGEGHIAEVLGEYFEVVAASDIFDYGYGEKLDFLKESAPAELIPADEPDWIITNPPFGDKGEAFVLRALELAQLGVAMFFRLQWLETIGRYEHVFSKFPPKIIAQFAERVPLHKGRWEPQGATATAYLWIVWLKERPSATEFLWIPPGQREALTVADDVERFTVSPVIKKIHERAAPSPATAAAPEPSPVSPHPSGEGSTSSESGANTTKALS